MKYVNTIILCFIILACSDKKEDVFLFIECEPDTISIDQEALISLKVENIGDKSISIHNGNSCLLSAKVKVGDNYYCASDFRICLEVITDLEISPGKTYEEEIIWKGEYITASNKLDTLGVGVYKIKTYAVTTDGDDLYSDAIEIYFEE